MDLDQEYNDRFILELSDDDTSYPLDDLSDEDLEADLEKKFNNLSLNPPQQGKLILSIDIGIHHLGMVLVSIDNRYKFQDVLWMDLINIMEVHCLPNCKLYHTKTYTDLMAHILHKYNDTFEKADIILIERQPPQGLVVIEQFLFCAWRDKSILMAPNSVHAHFNMNNLTYDQRKIASVRIASEYIPVKFRNKLAKFTRQHDISDCILFVLYWIYKKREELKTIRLEQKRSRLLKKYNKGLGMSIDEFYERFRYVPERPKI